MNNKSLNWEEIEAAATNSQFKNYANNGEYKVKVASVEGKENGNGWFEFQFEESEVKYPKLSMAFFGDDKVNYRAHYYKEVMKLLGASESAARKAVETCESKETRKDAFNTYVQMFTRLVDKHPQIEIEVRDQYDRDGNPVCSENGTVYGESVFTKKSGLQFRSNKPQTPVAAPAEEPSSDDDLLEEMPF